MKTEHPITPPPELVEQWRTAPEYTTGKEMFTMVSVSTRRLQEVATQAARWGADQELEACVNYVDNTISGNKARALRAARRPKPPSLKELALATLDDAILRGDCITISDALPILRRALEQLDD